MEPVEDNSYANRLMTVEMAPILLRASILSDNIIAMDRSRSDEAGPHSAISPKRNVRLLLTPLQVNRQKVWILQIHPPDCLSFPYASHHGMKRVNAYRQAYAVGKIRTPSKTSSLKSGFERGVMICGFW